LFDFCQDFDLEHVEIELIIFGKHVLFLQGRILSNRDEFTCGYLHHRIRLQKALVVFVNSKFFESEGGVSGDEVGGLAGFEAVYFPLRQNGVSGNCLVDGRFRRLQSLCHTPQFRTAVQAYRILLII